MAHQCDWISISHHTKKLIKKERKNIFLQHSFFDIPILESQPKVAFAFMQTKNFSIMLRCHTWTLDDYNADNNYDYHYVFPNLDCLYTVYT